MRVRRKTGPQKSHPTVACFGELLWDCLPRGLFLGGAPINAAYHLAQQGLDVIPITAVGRDFLGDEARRRIESWGLDLAFVGRHPARPTGTVRAQLDAKGQARYEIARNVAWDDIETPAALVRRAPTAVVYGTLALRSRRNRAALARVLREWPDAMRVADLNFRPPFASAEITDWVLQTAQLVKLNDEELATLTGEHGRSSRTLEKLTRRLTESCGLKRVCVTAGARGAGLWWDGAWYWENAHPVTVRDTVGAGDAFLGALLGALLARRASPKEALAQACRMGEFVAARDGATPAYQLDAHGHPKERV